MRKIPSPCIDICKFKRRGHCLGCSMTKAQKGMFKRLSKPKHKVAFVRMLMHQQAQLGGYGHWSASYRAKLARKKITAVGFLESDY